MSWNLVEMSMKDCSQYEVNRESKDDFNDTMRAFELSQLNQRNKKPRTSNFLGDFDFYTQNQDTLSIWNSVHKGQMGTIQEGDDRDSQSEDDDENSNSKLDSTGSAYDRTRDNIRA